MSYMKTGQILGEQIEIFRMQFKASNGNACQSLTQIYIATLEGFFLVVMCVKSANAAIKNKILNNDGMIFHLSPPGSPHKWTSRAHLKWQI